MSRSIRRPGVRSGFTLIELLVVVGIILVLLGILLPVANKIIAAAHKADTQAQMTKLSTAIQAYFTTMGSYPGPIPESYIWGYNTDASTAPTISTPPTPMVYSFTSKTAEPYITSSQNLVLGLLGGLKLVTANAPPVTFDVIEITNGNGPRGLNLTTPQQFPPFIEFVKTELPQDSTGAFTSWLNPSASPQAPDFPAALAKSSVATDIPEFVDHFPNPKPIIYLRCRPGAGEIADVVISSASAASATGSPWYSMEMAPYWVVYDGTQPNRTPKPNPGNAPFPCTPNGPAPTNQGDTQSSPLWTMAAPKQPGDLAFFMNQTLKDNFTPRAKDAFILISAGPDGVYGTSDDIIIGN